MNAALNQFVILPRFYKLIEFIMQEVMTFNDLPIAMTQVLSRIEKIEDVLKDICISMTRIMPSDDHIPMTIDEACEFMKMKKTTMYYHIEHGNIPATKRGKNYILFKDELIHWFESGRKNSRSMTLDEMNETFKVTMKSRKPNKG